MAEHDIGTQSDGPHANILIRKSVKHGQYNVDSKVHDIAIVYLDQDVEFSGKFGWVLNVFELKFYVAL